VQADSDVSPEVYELVGRIALRASLLEERLVELAVKLDMLRLAPGAVWADELKRAEGEHGGTPGTTLVSHVRRGYGSQVADLDKAEFEAFLDKVEQALNARHEIVHSVWIGSPTGVAPGCPDLFGLRHLPKHKRGFGGGLMQSATRDVKDLRNEVERLDDLIHWLEIWKNRLR
jgi:hypothetical protein